MIYSIGRGGLKPLSSEGKNDLPIGTILHLHGYNEPDYVICGKRRDNYVCVNPGNLSIVQKEPYSLYFEDADEPLGIHTSITKRTMPANEALNLLAQANDLQSLRNEMKARNEKEKEERIKTGLIELAQLRPVWAKSVIVARMEHDDCDIMRDYFNVTHDEPYFIAWSKHTRDLFPEMRKAAGSSGMKEIEHFYADPQKEDEHREKYSMGSGYYLKRGSGYSTGWTVFKTYINEQEIALAIEDERFLAKKN